MKVSKSAIKIFIYFFPVLFIHIFFCIIDIFLVGMIIKQPLISNIRVSMINLSIYFLFFVVPLYLTLITIIRNIKSEVSNYYEDIKYIFLSITISNIIVLIINIISNNVLSIYINSYFIEFFLLFISQIIACSILSYLGSFIIEKDYD